LCLPAKFIFQVIHTGLRLGELTEILTLPALLRAIYFYFQVSVPDLYMVTSRTICGCHLVSTAIR
jgi:hypothetical protein